MLLRVERSRAEEARIRLAENGILDRSRRIVRAAGWVDFPVLALPPGELGKITQEEAGMRSVQIPPYYRIMEMADIPSHLKPALPDKWEKLGRVVVLRLPGELLGFKTEVARAYAEVLEAETVLRDVSGSRGDAREPTMEILLGENTETINIEDGIKYCFDAARIMFSSGNMAERIRMGKTVEPGETVVDMFAGIGYFSLPMAVHGRPKRVFACEMSPVSHRYLQRNAAINKVGGIVEPLLGDCREVAPEGIADRVVMGHFRAMDYLDTAVRVLKPGGGIVHVHALCRKDLIPQGVWETIRLKINELGKRAELQNTVKVKSFRPRMWHIVLDVAVTEN
jgi:tRNA wybutosine-synthesizing protein 2